MQRYKNACKEFAKMWLEDQMRYDNHIEQICKNPCMIKNIKKKLLSFTK